MSKVKVTLVRLDNADRNQFILDNQEAFKYGATEEFGMRDNHLEADGEIISHDTIEHAIDEVNAEAYRIVSDGQLAWVRRVYFSAVNTAVPTGTSSSLPEKSSGI